MLNHCPAGSSVGRHPPPCHASRRHALRVGLAAIDPQTGEVLDAPIDQQTGRVLEQLKLGVETGGSSLDQVLKCNVCCTSVEMFPIVNEIYAQFFGAQPPARIFVNVPAWPGRFDIEIDCIAAV
ncbi:Rid family hydrolase [Paraburkholderia phytofirmans]|uniref:Rid family hydrolase n=1 Tax=Paraburkholderia phytofirmans TaxID=261302 RepID=UPI0038BB4E80